MRNGLYLGGASLPYVSSLRIYQPLESYTAAQQRYIEEHLVLGQDRVSIDAQELADSLGRISRDNANPLPTHAVERVRTLQMDPELPTLYSPNQVVARSYQAAADFQHGPTAHLAQMLMPEEVWAPARRRADGSEGMSTPVQTRISTWGIPFSWFVLVSERDRTEVVEAAGQVLTVRIQVPLPLAAHRAASVLVMLEENAPDLDLYEELDQLHDWLGGYSRDAVVELDYGPVANRVYPDESPVDVRLGLECLAEGDLTGAAAAYRRLASRWIPIRQLARAS
ncbi:hypothetical protein [Arthrobacter sp. 35W]|uniref:hypothetical protein n=1 Tax=Arthrobacter sp. 35W TaxID=1132441 RepID=UPI000429107B|nr:hypothetical protein [Arthrobacter sp. 35W]